ncbi:type II toxin-antitoxin system VapC family toxin [Sphaerospermopsis sp. LEGE 08334]|jgi:predicted nucleic acid-binding protein|uniref:type II toxin-antitoxin system VapC family toxin n=1 Tax=Sphaerospermopsis sp. LEGE 08334 TaxID=1828651 RepID=UPI00187E160F|nr:hypothetical protein [Sphaerospermopsis sp. LEGE 08334]MBE9056747.1 hypothetical protein [Sphaerospermopsis sp. LEGE 08334]
MILLDSDIVIDFLRKYPPAIIWLSSLGDEEIALPGYVAMELMQGCKNKVVFVWMMVNKIILNFSPIIIKLYPVNPLILVILIQTKIIHRLFLV